MSPDPFAPRRRDTAHSLEIERICRLPVVESATAEEVEALSRQVVQAAHFEAGYRLHPEQVGGLLAYETHGGLFGPIGVGRGKTNLTLLILDRAFRRGESARSLLTVPPNVLGQLAMTDIPAARRILGIRIPFMFLHGLPPKSRMQLARSGKRGCYVMPYSYWSLRDTEEFLLAMAPDLVVLDEAHRVKQRSGSARAGRLMRLLRTFDPHLVALSGTITNKSIKDYHHLLTHCLGEGSPLPVESGLIDAWASVLDAGAGDNPGSAATGPIAPLVDWAQREFPKEEIPRGLPGFRTAFRLRLNSAPGVVASGEDELGTSLIMRNVPVAHPEECDGAAELARLEKQVEDLWISPSGDLIEHGMHKWRYLYELASGFYYRLRWPEVAELVQRQRLTEAEAFAYLERAKEHHAVLQAYHGELRFWIQHHGRPGLDTPMLVGGDMARHGTKNVSEALYEKWTKARELEFDGMPERLSEPVRVSSWKVRHAATLAVLEQQEARKDGEPEGVLVWYHHREFGDWLVEELRDLGADPLWCPADSVRSGSSGVLANPQNQGRIMVVSMSGHGTGVNLQGDLRAGGTHRGFRRQILAEFPRKADLLEQVLGRTHRYGQEADELVPVTVNTSTFDHLNTCAALVDAMYIHQSTGSRQKAIYATYDPLPPIYPSDFLRERGFVDVAQLDSRARAALEEKFGSAVARGARTG